MVPCNHIELSKSILLISCFFLLFSVLTNLKVNSNIENHYNQCFIGNHLKDDSNKKSFPKKIRLILLKDVTERGRALLEWRCEVKISELDLNKESYYHYDKMYLSRYESLQKYCFDLYNTHGDHFVTSK